MELKTFKQAQSCTCIVTKAYRNPSPSLTPEKLIVFLLHLSMLKSYLCLHYYLSTILVGWVGPIGSLNSKEDEYNRQQEPEDLKRNVTKHRNHNMPPVLLHFTLTRIQNLNIYTLRSMFTSFPKLNTYVINSIISKP